MTTDHSIFVGRGESPQHLLLKLANRHGLIAGATGTGKTVSLQILAEGFSSLGVPVFLADVKGDLSGLCQPGTTNPKLAQRAQDVQLDDYVQHAFPTIFWDLYGQRGHPIRTTISEMGPLLISRLLQLNDTQEGVLDVAFKLADDEGLLLLDLKDFRAMLNFVGDNASKLTMQYGRVSKASVGAIQRRLLSLEQQGGDNFFGEPALDLFDFMRTAHTGQGYINILAADKLIHQPRLYSTVLLWLLSELFEELPEVGDPERPKLVFFFDEAHLLFKDAPKALLEKIEQVVRLVRSKGVGIYFISQNPRDVPDAVLGQLANRIQHALRAYTPREKKAVKTAAETFRPNPNFDAAQAITQLGVGEALVSTLNDEGIPNQVDRALIRPPSSRLGPATESERQTCIKQSPLLGRYDEAIDRLSAYEHLKTRAEQAAKEAKTSIKAKRYDGTASSARRGRGNRQSVAEALAKSVARSVGSALGRRIIRGLLGSLMRGRS